MQEVTFTDAVEETTILATESAENTENLVAVEPEEADEEAADDEESEEAADEAGDEA